MEPEPRSAKGRRTRARLLEAGKTVFERDGFLQARISDIAAEAQVSHGSFYHYFDSKESVLDELFTSLGNSFSDCSSFEFEWLAYDVVGDMAYTAGFEHTSASVDGHPRTYTLRATQVYRREEGEWRVAHRHGDTVTD